MSTAYEGLEETGEVFFLSSLYCDGICLFYFFAYDFENLFTKAIEKNKTIDNLLKVFRFFLIVFSLVNIKSLVISMI